MVVGNINDRYLLYERYTMADALYWWNDHDRHFGDSHDWQISLNKKAIRSRGLLSVSPDRAFHNSKCYDSKQPDLLQSGKSRIFLRKRLPGCASSHIAATGNSL